MRKTEVFLRNFGILNLSGWSRDIQSRHQSDNRRDKLKNPDYTKNKKQSVIVSALTIFYDLLK